MIDYNSLERLYIKKISNKFKVMLGNKIYDDYCQDILKKAIKYKLTDKEYKNLFSVGRQTAKEYPGLFYLAAIYCHPLTIGQGILERMGL